MTVTDTRLVSVGFPVGLLPGAAGGISGVVRKGAVLHEMDVPEYRVWYAGLAPTTPLVPTLSSPPDELEDVDDIPAKQRALESKGFLCRLEAGSVSRLLGLRFVPMGRGIGLNLSNGLCRAYGFRSNAPVEMGRLLYFIWANSGRDLSLSDVCDEAARVFATEPEQVGLHVLDNVPLLLTSGLAYLDELPM